MFDWFKCKKKENELHNLHMYYAKRICEEEINHQKSYIKNYEKMKKYRDKLIEKGIELPE